MLVLSRKLGEKILIPELDTEITIVAIHGSKVQIGIAAPSHVAIRRHELPNAVEDAGALINVTE